MDKITKKLVSAVTGNKNIFGEVTIKDNSLIYRYRYKCAGQITNNTEFINLDTFVRLCKEWALSKGYIIDEKGYWLYILTDDSISDMYNSYGKPFCPFRVFEACEWIVALKSNKKEK